MVFRCLESWVLVARRTNNTLERKKPTRKYRKICWISTEGQTERDYLNMNVFRNCLDITMRFVKDIHPGGRNPCQVLNRLQKALKKEDFRNGDEAWLVVDVDEWNDTEFAKLLEWVKKDSRHHLAISNPKFELFLVMHFERGNGCTTSKKVDAALKKYLSKYVKRISATQFTLEQVRTAIENARMKRTSCNSEIPDPGMTDMYSLVERLIGVDNG